MSRRIAIVKQQGASEILIEVAAHDELQLQERMKADPDLLPIDELGLEGPLLIVGRETPLASGSIDLVGLAKGGQIVLIEFKTGPQNPDFRAALAQLLDYGSDLWGMEYESFEENVALRYLHSDRCPAGPTKNASSLDSAVKLFWSLNDQDAAAVRDQLAESLRTGGFRYVVVAQRFTPAMAQTVRYLNDAMPSAYFALVEMVRFGNEALSVFEARAVYKPERRRSATVATAASESKFLGSLTNDQYRETVENFFTGCRELGLRFEWGSLGTSIRLLTPDKSEPVSIAWVFPPGVTGWMGLTDIGLGFDPAQAGGAPSKQGEFEQYVSALAKIPGAVPFSKAGLNAYVFVPADFVANYPQVFDAVARVVSGEDADNPPKL